MNEGISEWERHALEKLRQGLYSIVTFLIMLMVIYGIICLCRTGYGFCYEIFGPVVVDEAPGQDISFTIRDGESMRNVSIELKEHGIIVNDKSFYIRAKLMDSENIFPVAGEYILNTSMDYEEIIDMITVSDWGQDL